MDPAELLIPLDGSLQLDAGEVGGKAARLNELAAAGFRVPRGFCLATPAYGLFLDEHDLEPVLRAELGRKPLGQMRWEELWDAALRLRSVFLARPVPEPVRDALQTALAALGAATSLAVRSSAPREDAAGASFAGLHESVVDVRGEAALLDAVRVVWSSLWSDAALLYLAELGMDPSASRMAVVVQELVTAAPSGVAFGTDPREHGSGRQIVEAVPGPCGDLVDGAVDPDRWTLERSTGAVLSWRAGERGGPEPAEPLLAPAELGHLHGVLLSVEEHCGWPPDVEWTGRGERFHLLQARPVTGAASGPDDGRRWYLGLRPGLRRLRELRRRVAGERIPALEEEGERLAREDLGALDDRALAAAIEERAESLGRWRDVYRDEFIPFAHGLRALGTYYNDLVRPEDPFEFVGLVRGEELRALRRNRGLAELAARLQGDSALAAALERALAAGPGALQVLRAEVGESAFLRDYEALSAESFDLEYAGERLCDRPDVLLRHVLELARAPAAEPAGRGPAADAAARSELERRLLAAAGPERAEEAAETLAVGRLSWRLRDDDNLLLGRVESQLLRALEEARRRLAAAGRVAGGGRAREESATALAGALRDPDRRVTLAAETRSDPAAEERAERPRQLVGQPGSPGLATGPARLVRGPDDTARFRRGDVLLCDAIQPNMTHLVPLACGVVERRGGMLIHGAVIARELGIPCVNGVSAALADVPDGETVTVDGDLGIATVGAPDFRLEGVDLD